jgi:hypothetical protein
MSRASIRCILSTVLGSRGVLKGCAAAIVCVTVLAATATADAAQVGIRPIKSCYRSGESLFLGGFGYTPNSAVNVTADGTALGTLATAANGTFGGTLRVGLANGEKVKQYSATDQVNPAITASTAVRVSALDVGVKPKRGRPGRRVRIKARGFTTGSRLYAHIRRGRRYKRNVRIGRLKRACHKLTARKRLFSRRTKSGVYKVQFDTKRRYSSKTAAKVLYSVTVFRTIRPANASAASAPGERWAAVR